MSLIDSEYVLVSQSSPDTISAEPEGLERGSLEIKVLVFDLRTLDSVPFNNDEPSSLGSG